MQIVILSVMEFVPSEYDDGLHYDDSDYQMGAEYAYMHAAMHSTPTNMPLGLFESLTLTTGVEFGVDFFIKLSGLIEAVVYFGSFL